MESEPTMGAKDFLFELAGPVMIRVPLLPLTRLKQLMHLPLESPAAISAGTNSTDLVTAIDTDTFATQEWLKDALSDPVIEEAILASSPDLYQAIPRWESEPKSVKGRRIQNNLLRYLTRMATRSTPYGILAGVTTGNIAQSMDVRVGKLEEHHKRTRPDMQWLLYLVQKLEQRQNVIPHLHFFTNPVAFVAGGRMFVPRLDSYGQPAEQKVISMRLTVAAARALALACNGITIDSLTESLLTDLPHATVEQVQGLLVNLRRYGALLSDLRPPLTDADPFHHVLTKIEGISGCDDIVQQMHIVDDLCMSYDQCSLGHGIGELQALRQAAQLSNFDIHSTLAIDTRISLESRDIAESVINEVRRAAEVILSLSTISPEKQHLSAYRREFMERYGEGREILLLELLDDDIGLGPPSTYQSPPPRGERLPMPAVRHPQRDQRLLNLLATALHNRQHEIELDEDTVTDLQILQSWDEMVPGSLELYVSIAASSQEAITNGDFTILIAPRTGTSPAGRSFGRFCGVIEQDIVQFLRELARKEESLAREKLFAEIVYLPIHGHAANICVHPPIRKYEIVVGAMPGVPYADTIPMNDLVVGVCGDRFYARSISRNAEVIATTTHLLNYLSYPNECRFLIDVSEEGTIPLQPFDWSFLRSSPFLPRLRFGKIILFPATWQLPAKMAKTSMSDWDHVWWYRTFQDWRTEWNVPRYVYMVEEDNRLLLDLENPVCVNDVANECQKYANDQGVITLQEMVPGFEDTWTVGPNGLYAAEFVIPFARRRQEKNIAPRLVKRAQVNAGERLRVPGSDWLFAKLYVGQNRQEDLLSGPIRDYVDWAMQEKLIDSWFFIRYADPEPHIRLRLHGEPTHLLLEIIPTLTEWTESLIGMGIIRKLVLDTYEREIERYGGIDGILVAEQIFAADSDAVTEIIALRSSKSLVLSIVDVALRTVDTLLSSLGLVSSERLSLYHTIRQEREKSPSIKTGSLQRTFHGYRTIAQRIVGDSAWLYDQPGGPDFEACLQKRKEKLLPLGKRLRSLSDQGHLVTSQVAFMESCIHMHCNRLLGTSRLAEFEVIYYLERTLQSLERYTPAGIMLSAID